MKKTLSLVLALLMMLSIVPMASAEEALPEVVVYMMGDKPADCDMVMEKVNEILKKELGCTMSMNFIGWADWGTAYQLLLTGGNKIDLIYNASWASDKDYARSPCLAAASLLAAAIDFHSKYSGLNNSFILVSNSDSHNFSAFISVLISFLNISSSPYKINLSATRHWNRVL